VFKSPYKDQHKIGGRLKERGLKYYGCFTQNTCLHARDNVVFEPVKIYSEVSTKSDFCNLTHVTNFTFNVPRNETFQKSYYQECIKSNHPNVIICPNNTELPLMGSDQYLVDNLVSLRNLEKELEQNKSNPDNNKAPKRKSRKKCKGKKCRQGKRKKKTRGPKRNRGFRLKVSRTNNVVETTKTPGPGADYLNLPINLNTSSHGNLEMFLDFDENIPDKNTNGVIPNWRTIKL